jgi:hypothetical protein
MTFSGRVSFSGTSLAPPDNLQTVSVRLVNADPGPTVSVGVANSAAQEDGTFSIAGVTPGRYVLTATVPRPPGIPDAAWVPARAMVGGRNLLDDPFDVLPGGDIEGVTIEFVDRSAEVSGTLTDGSGRPIRDLTMILISAEPDRWLPMLSSRFQRTARPDANGRFQLPRLPPGDYFLAALNEIEQADLRDPAFLEQVAANAIRLTLAEGERKVQDIALAGGGGGLR